jgi:hypothetical protein
MSTHVEIKVPVVADSLIHNSACTKTNFTTTESTKRKDAIEGSKARPRNISRFVTSRDIRHIVAISEKPCVVVLLRNNHREFGGPVASEKLACLHHPSSFRSTRS